MEFGSPEAQSPDELQLRALHDTIAPVLPSYAPLESNRVLTFETQDGLPMTYESIAVHTYEVHGVVARDLAPEAATALQITERDVVQFSYVPPQLFHEDQAAEPDQVPPSITVDITDVVNAQDGTHFTYTVGDAESEWQSSRTDQEALTPDEFHAVQTLVQQFETLAAEMLARGLGSEDMDAYHREAHAAEQVAKLIRGAEIVARQASEERFSNVPMQGNPLGENTLHKLRYAPVELGVFSHVTPDQVGQLRTKIAEALLNAQTAAHSFGADTVNKISPLFHDAQQARQTTVKAVTLSARPSEAGPVFIYTITKDVLLKNGVQREEIDTFLLQESRYIRILTLYDTDGMPDHMQVDAQNPMTRAQHHILGVLTTLVPKKA